MIAWPVPGFIVCPEADKQYERDLAMLEEQPNLLLLLLQMGC